MLYKLKKEKDAKGVNDKICIQRVPMMRYMRKAT